VKDARKRVSAVMPKGNNVDYNGRNDLARRSAARRKQQRRCGVAAREALTSYEKSASHSWQTYQSRTLLGASLAGKALATPQTGRAQWKYMATAVVVEIFSFIGGCLLLRRNR
jgi:hypothetical protein